MFWRIVLLFALFLAIGSIDLCELVSSDYCFYFGQSSCYLKICECEQETCAKIDDDSCTYSYWCDVNGDYIVNDTDIKVVDRSCDSLKQNCLNKTFFNGYCHFYKEMNCATDQAIENLGHKKSLPEACKKWGQICVKKYSRHFACRQFRKFCHNFSLPPRVGNITEELDDIRKYPHHPEEHGEHWERNMISRCRRWQRQCYHNKTHFCRKVERRRCENFLSNSTVIPLREDHFSSEEDEDSVSNILSSTDEKTETSTQLNETSIGPNYRKNMKARCKAWRSYCNKHPNSGQCETYFRRCEEFSSNYKKDFANAMGNHTAISE